MKKNLRYGPEDEEEDDSWEDEDWDDEDWDDEDYKYRYYDED